MQIRGGRARDTPGIAQVWEVVMDGGRVSELLDGQNVFNLLKVIGANRWIYRRVRK